MTQPLHNAAMVAFSRFAAFSATLVVAIAACSPTGDSAGVRSPAIPAASGSMGPNLVSGPDGTIVLSWMEPDRDGHQLRLSVLDDDLQWSAAQTVSRGDNWFVNWADFPSVVPLSDDLWAAHWLASQPAGGYAYDVNIALSSDNGATWSAPFLPHSDGTPTEHGFVTLFPDGGGVGAVWLDGRKMINDYDENDVKASGMTLRSGTFGLPRPRSETALVDDLTCDCCQTDLALTDEGPVVVYRDRTVDEIRDIYVSRRVNGQWTNGAPVAVDNWEIPACPVNGPIIRAAGNQVAVAWFTAANDVPLVKVAWSADSGKTFSDPIIVSDVRPLGHIGATLLPDGNFVVIYQESAGSGEADLYLRAISPSGTKSAPLAVANSEDVFAFSVPQITNSDNELVIVWTNQVDDKYSIQSAVMHVSGLGEMQ